MINFLRNLFSRQLPVEAPKFEAYIPQYESTSNSTTIVITTEKEPTKKELENLKKKIAPVKPKVARKAPVRKKKETPSSSD